MGAAEFVVVGDEWLPATTFPEDEDSLLRGAVSFPLASFLTADQALHMADAADRLIAWATAMKLRAVARVEEAMGEEPIRRREGQPVRLSGDEAHAIAVAEVATAGAISEAAAARLLHDAADVGSDQWEVLEALEAGDLSPAHARVILDQARTVPAEHAEEFSRAALQRACTRFGRRRTPSELRACLRRLREQLHPESIEARKKAALRERGVWVTPESDGMCTLSALLPAEAGLAIFNGLDHDARTAQARITEPKNRPGREIGPDPRTLSELRADSLVQRLLGSAYATGQIIDGDPSGGKPSRAAAGGGSRDSADSAGPFRAEVVVTIPVQLALGLKGDGTALRGARHGGAANHACCGSADDGGPGYGAARVRAPGAGGGAAYGGAGAAGMGAVGGADDDGASSGAAGAAGFRAAGGAPDGAVTGWGLRATAEIEGYGPIDDATARRLAALAPTWHRLFVDGRTGRALGVGRTAYRPPKALRRYLAYRDGTCRFPGCTRPASVCEPDHMVEWQDGGTTDPANLTLLCRRHHALKSIGAWTYTHAPPELRSDDHDDGGAHLEWRSPLGRAHLTEPAENCRPVYGLTPEPDAEPGPGPEEVVAERPPPF